MFVEGKKWINRHFNDFNETSPQRFEEIYHVIKDNKSFFMKNRGKILKIKFRIYTIKFDDFFY